MLTDIPAPNRKHVQSCEAIEDRFFVDGITNCWFQSSNLMIGAKDGVLGLYAIAPVSRTRKYSTFKTHTVACIENKSGRPRLTTSDRERDFESWCSAYLTLCREASEFALNEPEALALDAFAESEKERCLAAGKLLRHRHIKANMNGDCWQSFRAAELEPEIKIKRHLFSFFDTRRQSSCFVRDGRNAHDEFIHLYLPRMGGNIFIVFERGEWRVVGRPQFPHAEIHHTYENAAATAFSYCLQIMTSALSGHERMSCRLPFSRLASEWSRQKTIGAHFHPRLGT